MRWPLKRLQPKLKSVFSNRSSLFVNFISRSKSSRFLLRSDGFGWLTNKIFENTSVLKWYSILYNRLLILPLIATKIWLNCIEYKKMIGNFFFHSLKKFPKWSRSSFWTSGYSTISDQSFSPVNDQINKRMFAFKCYMFRGRFVTNDRQRWVIYYSFIWLLKKEEMLATLLCSNWSLFHLKDCCLSIVSYLCDALLMSFTALTEFFYYFMVY